MGWKRGTLTQKFKVEVDIDKLIDLITDQILANISDEGDVNSIELDERYMEDDMLVINGSYDANFKSIYTPATRWEPADYEEERPRISDGNSNWMLHGLPNLITENLKINRVVENDEECEFKYWGGEE